VGTGVDVGVGLSNVAVGVQVGVGKLVGVTVSAGVPVAVAVELAVAVGEGEGEGEAVRVEVGVAVATVAASLLTLLTSRPATATRAMRPVIAPAQRGRLLAFGSSGSETVPVGWAVPNSARRSSVIVWKRLAGCSDMALEIARSVPSLRLGRCCRAGTRSLVTRRSPTEGGGVPVTA
jgi:hypothetical protein